jgi:hypothetical protein
MVCVFGDLLANRLLYPVKVADPEGSEQLLLFVDSSPI